MSDALNDDLQRRRPHAPAMAGPFLEFDLTREVGQLNAETGGAGGQTARTLVKLDDLRIVLITLTTGSRIPGHHSQGGVSIHVISGHLTVRAEGRSFNLHAGGLLALGQGVTHDVEANEDSALLLTVAWPGGGRPTPPSGVIVTP